MISVLSVCCCALLNFEVARHTWSFFYFIFIVYLILFFVFVSFRLLVPLNGIKKYLA